MTMSRITAFLVSSTLVLAPVQADLAGPYLAARQATISSDYQQAARYFSQAIATDKTNLPLLESAVLANLAAGDVPAAARIATRYQAAGGTNPLVELLLATDGMAAGNYEAVIALPDGQDALGQLLNGLLKAWAAIGQGDMSAALAIFGKVAEQEDLAQFARYHEGLAHAQVGDFQSAQDIMSGERYGPLTLSNRGIEAHAQVLVQLERSEDALELLAAAGGGGFSPELNALADQLEAGESPAFQFVTSPQEGAAEVLFAIGSILQGRASADLVLVYTRLAAHLRPDHAQASLMSAELLEDQGQFSLAEAAYRDVPEDHPAYFLAELGRAQAMFSDDRKEGAVEVLDGLTQAYPDISIGHATHGDFLGRVDRDAEAVAAYTRALELQPEETAGAWRIYYARGIVHERNDNFPAMEADFRKALELRPNEPNVLNYLGYSLVEQRMKLDEALGMIETAVAERPDSGYITDSLGWVFYRLGRFEEAVAPMERAVSLLPVDPIVNDHLGDVYWKVGRFREAEFQWKRALSFEPEEAEADRIRRKLEVGLDVVLQEEAAEKDE